MIKNGPKPVDLSKGSDQKKKGKVIRRTKSAYDFFLCEVNKNGMITPKGSKCGTFKKLAAQKWRELPEKEVQRFKKMAEDFKRLDEVAV